MRMLDLFSGIGGFSLAAKWVWGEDLEIVAFCEIDPFCQKILRKHWPEVPIIEDIKKVEWVVADSGSEQCLSRASRNMEYNESESVQCSGGERQTKEIPPINLLTGGFPCQPFSCAGKRAGREDDRFLWPEMLRAIHEVKPRWVVAENVSGILSLDEGMVFEGVCTELEAEGYEVIPLVIPACAVGAPHRRDRVWIVAHSISQSIRGRSDNLEREKRQDKNRSSLSWKLRKTSCREDCHAPNTEGRKTLSTEQVGFHTKSCSQNRDVADSDRLNGDNAGFGSGKVPQFKETEILRNPWQEHWYEVATRFCRVDDGVRNRVDRLKSLGNAIVPQVAEQIFRAIKDVESNSNP